MTKDIMKPDYANNMRLIGHSDQGGLRDGIQVMVEDGFAYIGHLFSQGFSIVDVRDPANPKPAGYVRAPANTWNVHLQAADGLLLVIHGKDVFADAAFSDEASYYKAAAGTALVRVPSQRATTRQPQRRASGRSPVDSRDAD